MQDNVARLCINLQDRPENLKTRAEISVEREPQNASAKT